MFLSAFTWHTRKHFIFIREEEEKPDWSETCIHNGVYHYHHTYIFHSFGFTFFHRTLMTWVTSLIISVVCATIKL